MIDSISGIQYLGEQSVPGTLRGQGGHTSTESILVVKYPIVSATVPLIGEVKWTATASKIIVSLYDGDLVVEMKVGVRCVKQAIVIKNVFIYLRGLDNSPDKAFSLYLTSRVQFFISSNSIVGKVSVPVVCLPRFFLHLFALKGLT